MKEVLRYIFFGGAITERSGSEDLHHGGEKLILFLFNDYFKQLISSQEFIPVFTLQSFDQFFISRP